MKILDRQKISPIFLMTGDTLMVTHDKHVYDASGQRIEATKLASTTINAEQAMTVDEALLFEMIFEDRRALGGMVLEKKKD